MYYVSNIAEALPLALVATVASGFFITMGDFDFLVLVTLMT